MKVLAHVLVPPRLVDEAKVGGQQRLEHLGGRRLGCSRQARRAGGGVPQQPAAPCTFGTWNCSWKSAKNGSTQRACTSSGSTQSAPPAPAPPTRTLASRLMVGRVAPSEMLKNSSRTAHRLECPRSGSQRGLGTLTAQGGRRRVGDGLTGWQHAPSGHENEQHTSSPLHVCAYGSSAARRPALAGRAFLGPPVRLAPPRTRRNWAGQAAAPWPPARCG